jgi:hypothetical protein
VICGSLMAPANRLTLARLRETGEGHPALGKYVALGKIFSGKELTSLLTTRLTPAHSLSESSLFTGKQQKSG